MLFLSVIKNRAIECMFVQYITYGVIFLQMTEKDCVKTSRKSDNFY